MAKVWVQKDQNNQNNDNNESKQEQKQQDKNPDSKKVTILLTGSTGVIGGAIASGLVSSPNVSLHLLARNEGKIQNLIKTKLNKSKHQTSTIKYHLVDLSSKKSINSFITKFTKEWSYLDILVNNAAIVPSTYNITADNEELQFSVNVMSYMRLMNGLLPLLAKSGQDKQRRIDIKQLSNYGECAKIVNVASQYTTALSTDPGKYFNLSPNMKSNYDSNQQYKKTKAADRMLTYKASQIFIEKGYNIGVFSCHPGVTSSNVLSGLGFGSGWESAVECAKTPLFLATNKSIGLKQSGRFFKNSRVQDCQYCRDKNKVQIIWDYCQKLL